MRNKSMPSGSLHQRGVKALMVLVMTMVSATSVGAEFNERGRLEFEDPELSYSFDSDEPGPLVNRIFNQTSEAPDFEFPQNSEGLEGSGAFRLDGKRLGIVLEMGEAWYRLKGRRVSVTLWMQSHGTDASARINWSSPSYRRQMERVPRVGLGSVRLIPTGRSTSDGWVEFGTGPFDLAMDEVLPGFVQILDTQIFKQRGLLSTPVKQDAYVLLDALEVKDLGPAAVSAVSCDSTTEDKACGKEGACLLGRCVDAKAALGNMPTGQVGQDYIARKIFEVKAFSGPREGRKSIPEFVSRLMNLEMASVKEYWSSFRLAHNLLLDGHGGIPSDSPFSFRNTSGICLGPGVPDMLPERPNPAPMLPMVFSARPDFSASKLLQPGDVLTKIDGVDVWQWVEDNRGEFYSGWDRDGYRVYIMHDMINTAKRFGSILQFERCASTDGTVCEKPEVILVDFAKLLGEALWQESPPQEMLMQTNDCDFRFKRAVELDGDKAGYHQAGWKDSDGIRHLLINSTSNDFDERGQKWHATVGRGLQGDPEHIMLDQRTGYGGLGYYRVVGNLLFPKNQAVSLFVPWVGEKGITTSMRNAMISCARSNSLRWGDNCGRFRLDRATRPVRDGNSRNSKLAVLNAFGASGNDYLARYLTFRKSPTRIFGYAPTMGAYGGACRFPRHLMERVPMRYQCHDTTFHTSATRPAQKGWESGFGVKPDELVYQKQSDAINGKDTLIEAAKAWLLSDEEGEAP